MSGMLGRASANVPALGTRAEVFVVGDASKGYCKAWPRGLDAAEPTSVLDIQSPSPSSTLSSSLGVSSESGVQGSTESGGVVAVSALFYEGSSEGQLPDCTSLLEGGGEVGSVWGVGTGEDGGAGDEFVGTWQASSGNMHRGWERNPATRQDGACKHVDGPPSLIEGVVAGLLPGGNVGLPLNPGFVQVLGMAQEKQGQGGGQGLQKPEVVNISSSVRFEYVKNVTEKTIKHEVAGADGSLEACVMSCRKRDREDSLGEVVQRLGAGSRVGGQRIEAGEWLPDWNDFGGNASSVALEEKVLPGQLEDLDDLFGGSPAQPPSVEFWLSDNSPPEKHLQVAGYGAGEVSRGDTAGHGNLQSSNRVQLDLFEAVQAGLLYKGGNNSAGISGSGGFSSSAISSPRPTIFQPSNQTLSRSLSTPALTSPLSQQFSAPGRSQLPVPRHSLGSSALLTPDFVDVKPAVPASPLLNPTVTPAPPQFSSQLQFHEPAFPRSASYKNAPPTPAHLFGLPKPEYRPPKAEFADSKPWQMRMLEGEAASKVIRGGPPKWQVKSEAAGWSPVSPSHVKMPALSQQHLSTPGEKSPRCQAITPEQLVGRCVRQEEVSLAERLLSAASEAARHGNFVLAQAILARLNQQTSSKGQQQNQHQQQLPSQRVITLFSEALAKCVSGGSSTCTLSPFQPNTALDVINKISAYKSFCEVSPISQFAHFTVNQAILDATEGEDCIHLVDFELGFGGQWASFMQEISQRGRGPPELKITTMGVDSLEMRLAKENLLQFAKEMEMKLEINVIQSEKLVGIKAGMVKKGEKEAVVVNFGFGLNRLMSEFSSSSEAVLGFLQMVKGLSPKVVAVVDCECEFEGTSAFAEALQFYSCVFESLEACTKLPQEVVGNIEGLVFGPKIADLVNARHASNSNGESGLPPWRILLQKVGFSALPFSNAAESQANWLVKNPLNSGFTFVKQHYALLLGWYNKTLVSASAWV